MAVGAIHYHHERLPAEGHKVFWVQTEVHSQLAKNRVHSYHARERAAYYPGVTSTNVWREILKSPKLVPVPGH